MCVIVRVDTNPLDAHKVPFKRLLRRMNIVFLFFCFYFLAVIHVLIDWYTKELGKAKRESETDYWHIILVYMNSVLRAGRPLLRTW